MAAVGRRDSFLNNIIPLCVFLLIITKSASSRNADSNVLTTGQTLVAGDSIGYPSIGVGLYLTYYCDLVISYRGNVRWHSNTGSWNPFKRGKCTLSFTDNGRLVLTDNSGKQLWISSNDKSRVGKYIAIIRPEAELFIYGPPIWAVGEPVGEPQVSESSSIISSTPIWAVGEPQVEESSISIISSSSDINNNEMVSSMTDLKKKLGNVLFSDHRLYNGEKISGNGYNFILDDCELILKDTRGKNTWQTWTHGNGIDCFARLNQKGSLGIFDKKNTLVWENDLAVPAPVGEYALVMQNNGTATIYGPDVWSTIGKNLGDILIKMPTTIEM